MQQSSSLCVHLESLNRLAPARVRLDKTDKKYETPRLQTLMQPMHISPFILPAGGTGLWTQVPSTGSTSSTVTRFLTMNVTWVADFEITSTDLGCRSDRSVSIAYSC